MGDTLSASSFGQIDPERLLSTHLARVFFAAQRERSSGVLTVDEGELTMHVHVVQGMVTYVDRGALAETLGRLLMRQGTIDREEYSLILERLAQPAETSEVRRFGEVAIQMGMLTEAELAEALHQQVEAKLSHCLTLDQGFWRWDGSRTPMGPRFPVALEPTLRAALLDDPQSYRWPGLLVAKRTRLIQLDGELASIADRFRLDEAERRVLRSMPDRPLATVLAGRVLPPEHVGVLIAMLIFAGQLDLQRPASVRLDRDRVAELRRDIRRRASGDAAEGVAQSAEGVRQEAVRAAGEQAHRLDRVREGAETATRARAGAAGRAEARARATAQAKAAVGAKAASASRAAAEQKAAALAKAAARVKAATHAEPRASARRGPSTAGVEPARDAADRLRQEMERRHSAAKRGAASDPRLDAERLFEKGRAALGANAVDRACEAFAQAVELMPDAAEYRLHLCWARYLGTQDPWHRTVFAEELRTSVLEALQQDRRMGFAHYVQGRLFLLDEDLEGAARALKIASRLDRSHVDSQRYLRLVERRLAK